MKLETRTCADPKCNAKFKCLPNSPQTGCCRDHDKRGGEFKQRLTMRRLKNGRVGV